MKVESVGRKGTLSPPKKNPKKGEGAGMKRIQKQFGSILVKVNFKIRQKVHEISLGGEQNFHLLAETKAVKGI